MFPDFGRDGERVVFFACKINDFAAFYTMQVMVVLPVRVKTPLGAGAFDDIHQTDIVKRKQSAIDRIKGDIGVFFMKRSVDIIHSRMVFRAGQFFVNQNSLRSNFQIVRFALLSEKVQIVVIIFFHVYII